MSSFSEKSDPVNSPLQRQQEQPEKEEEELQMKMDTTSSIAPPKFNATSKEQED